VHNRPPSALFWFLVYHKIPRLSTELAVGDSKLATGEFKKNAAHSFVWILLPMLHDKKRHPQMRVSFFMGWAMGF
jgi:hypothetical protein